MNVTLPREVPPAKPRRHAWLSILALLLLLSTAGRAASAPRLTEVAADRDHVTIRGAGASGRVEIAEVAPYEDASAARSRPSVVAGPSKNGEFTFRIRRFDQERDRIYSGWVARSGAELSGPRFVERMDGVACYTEPFPVTASKKGLQVQMVDDAIALGVKHAALNLDLAQMPDLSGASDALPWQSGGETFHFRRSTVEGLDRQIKPLSDSGAAVYLILLVSDGGGPEVRKLLLHPDYDPHAPNHLGGFNTTNADGVKWFAAMMEFLVSRYSRSDHAHGRASGFIVGNEVNSHWWWYNIGHVTVDRFAADYLRTLRILWTAARKKSSSARVYISLEHHWTISFSKDPQQSFPGRELIDRLGRLSNETGPFDWNVAFHPYPENLFECRTWLDKTALPTPDSPRITFKNLQELPRYLRRKELLVDGKPRRVILSEQGFHTANRPDGERDQAAAYAYAYYKASHLDGIDAFILHRHVDHKREGGLKLGLWTWKEGPGLADPGRKKPIYEVFRAADTPEWRKAFEFALPVIGIHDWSDLDAELR